MNYACIFTKRKKCFKIKCVRWWHLAPPIYQGVGWIHPFGMNHPEGEEGASWGLTRTIFEGVGLTLGRVWNDQLYRSSTRKCWRWHSMGKIRAQKLVLTWQLERAKKECILQATHNALSRCPSPLSSCPLPLPIGPLNYFLFLGPAPLGPAGVVAVSPQLPRGGPC